MKELREQVKEMFLAQQKDLYKHLEEYAAAWIVKNPGVDANEVMWIIKREGLDEIRFLAPREDDFVLRGYIEREKLMQQEIERLRALIERAKKLIYSLAVQYHPESGSLGPHDKWYKAEEWLKSASEET